MVEEASEIFPSLCIFPVRNVILILIFSQFTKSGNGEGRGLGNTVA